MRREKMLGLSFLMLVLLGTGTGFLWYFLQIQNKETLIVSTTTSLYDTGLLDEIKSEYEETHQNVLLAFISAGTGIAITHAMNGDADAILVHSPSQEELFMEQNFGINRRIVAYNFFSIVGPSDDPASISGLNVTSALNRIYAYGRDHNTSLWISRDDRSGTNTKEIALWAHVGLNYESIKEESWFVSSGTGMGSTLQIATELGLYVLSDIGTYLKYYSSGLITLEELVSSDSTLINVYSAIMVNATQVQGVKFGLASEFIQWLVGTNAQELIGSYGQAEYGQQLFIPAVSVVNTQSPLDVFTWIRDAAFFDFNGTLYECPPPWRTNDYSPNTPILILRIEQFMREIER
ncbi:MAG: substrate-binding domain-containing protein [Candidatus Thorarchaeota archaeon]|jgi:tungstate transport system substrate-binding protein